MTPLRRGILARALLATAALLPACRGPSDAPAALAGTVSYRREPVARGRLLLIPDRGRPAETAIVTGKFRFAADDGRPLLSPGTYRALVVALDESGTLSMVPEVYRDPDASPLRVVVPAGGEERAEIALE